VYIQCVYKTTGLLQQQMMGVAFRNIKPDNYFKVNFTSILGFFRKLLVVLPFFTNCRADEYIISNVVPLKKLIVSACNNFVKHFGNTGTSHEEGQHQIIKEYFNSSTGDLLTAVGNIHLSSKIQVHEFNATIEREKNTLYNNIRGKISATALALVQMQISAPRPRKEC